jgi:CRISPR-associated protein Csm5
MANWIIRTLSPVHVGSGSELTPLDYVYDAEARKVIVLDFEALLARPEVDPEELSRSLQRTGFSLEQLLRSWRIPPQEVARYSLAAPRNPTGHPIREQAKTPWYQPLIPGSSLKGAIRTALLWRFLEEGEHHAPAARYLQEIALGRHDAHRRGRVQPPDPRSVARRIEASTLGPEPNRDLLRALQVGDPEPLAKEALVVLRVDTYQIGERGQLQPNSQLVNYAESLKPGAQTATFLKLDESLLAPQAESELRFSRYRPWIDPQDGLVETLNRFATTILERESQFYRQAGLEEAARWCERCLERAKQPRLALVCVGWGSGWHIKTVGRLFQGEEGLDFMALRRKLGLGRSRSTGSYHPIFPKSRRLTLALEGGLQPLGWVELEEAKAG